MLLSTIEIVAIKDMYTIHKATSVHVIPPLETHPVHNHFYTFHNMFYIMLYSQLQNQEITAIPGGGEQIQLQNILCRDRIKV
jgi:hypothetical protein